MVYTFLFIIILFLNFLLGLFVFLRNPKNQINISFSLFVISVVSWMTVNYLSNNTTDYSLAFLFNKLIFLFSPYMSFSLLYFSIVFPVSKFRLKLKTLILILIPILVSNILTLLNFVITGITFIPGDGTGVNFDFGIYFFGFQFIVYFLISMIIMAVKYKKSTGHERAQLQYLLLGFGVLTIFGTITNFLIPLLFSNFSATDIGPLLALAIFGFTAYAILKHQLLNIKVIATEALVILMWILLLSKVFVSQSTNDFIINTILFALMVILGLLLIRSVLREVKQREQLEILNQKLKELDKRKDEFINIASHELRAPMTAIKGYLSMMIEGDTGKLPPKALEYLSNTSDVTERLIRLVNNMLNVSRIEENRMVFQIGKVKLSEVTQSVFDQFKEEAKGKGLTYDITIPLSIPDQVTVDPDRIHEVIANFISNAIKYTDYGSVHVALTQPNNSTIRFEVTDTGAGISKEEQTKLFQKFVRAESSVGKKLGTGLGLYISKLLVEKFHGSLGVISEGKGSTFWFELPLS